MRPQLLNIILIIASLNLVAQSGLPASRPYHLFSPDFDKLIPFSQDQLDIIKNNGITKVEEIWQPGMDETWKTVYEFNETGQLIGEYGFLKERGFLNMFEERFVPYDSVIYSYESQGYLISKKRNGPVYSNFDSIRYDSEYNAVYYDSYSHTQLEDTAFKEIYFNLRLKSFIGDSLVLVDRVEPDYPTEYYFKNNELVKVKDPYYTDSIEKIQIDSNMEVKEYWSKGRINSDFVLGMQEQYENCLLINSKVMNLYSPDHIVAEETYYYNRAGQVIRMEGNYEEVFTVYNNKGLVSSMIKKWDDTIYLTTYKYFYR